VDRHFIDECGATESSTPTRGEKLSGFGEKVSEALLWIHSHALALIGNFVESRRLVTYILFRLVTKHVTVLGLADLEHCRVACVCMGSLGLEFNIEAYGRIEESSPEERGAINRGELFLASETA